MFSHFVSNPTGHPRKHGETVAVFGSARPIFNQNCIGHHYSIYGYFSRKYFVLHFLDLMDDTLLDSVRIVKYLKTANPASVKFAKLMGYMEGLRDLSMTNLTRVTIKTDGEYTARDMAFVPPVVPYCKRTIGVVTLGNMMSITMNTVMANKTAERELFKPR